MKQQTSHLLNELLDGLVESDVVAIAVTGLALDSRRVAAGDLFIALAGTQARGHDFIGHAIKVGAAAVVYEPGVEIDLTNAGVPCVAVPDLSQKVGVIAERFCGHPSREMFIVGVTGTNGKTSCAHFIAQALSEAAKPCAVIGTLGNGLIGRLDQATHTTPDAVSLHALLQSFVAQGVKKAVMEVSSHGLEQGRVSGVGFDVAVFTNLTREHLDYHGDMQAYGLAKAKLFWMPGLRYAVINGDDAFGRELLSSMPAAVEKLVYTLSDQAFDFATVRGSIVQLNGDGFEMVVTTPWGEGRLRSSLLGRFNASNLLAVLTTLLLSGVEFEQALQKMAVLKTVPGRVERFGGSSGQPLVVVDYAHTPDALEQVLLTLREHCVNRLWCVFGCGGDRDQGKRPQMGEIAERYADHVVLTNDNPRHEDPAGIIADIRAGMRAVVEVDVIPDRAQAIAYAITQTTAGDVVLIAGKGHENYQQVGDERRPFSDRQHVQILLQEAA